MGWIYGQFIGFKFDVAKRIIFYAFEQVTNVVCDGRDATEIMKYGI